MKVAIFSTHVLLASHYETELEIIEEHHQNGDEVIQLVCNSDLPSCDTNPYYQPEACYRCVSKRENGTKLLSQVPKAISFYTYLTKEDKQFVSNNLRAFKSIDELKNYSIDGFDIGYAIASSLISYYRDPQPKLLDDEIERYMVGTLAIYMATRNFLEKEKPKVVYIFNGRLAHTKAVMRACQTKGVPFRIHERGHSYTHYSVFENFTIHQIQYMQAEMLRLWNSADPGYRDEKAELFYNRRMQGEATNWHAFNKDAENYLPENWDSSKINISIFNSSEDEVASISDEWKNPLYVNQFQGIKRITSDLLHRQDIHFYLRIHPNLKTVKNNDIDLLLSYQSPNITIIPPESKLNSYYLVKHSDKVITFGSSVGIEAVFLGIPSILAGKCFYRGLGSTYDPQTHDELVQLVCRKLDPLNKKAAHVYGYFFSSFGIPYKYYQPEDFGAGRFKGVLVKSTEGYYYKVLNWFFGMNSTFSERVRLRLRERRKNNLQS
jgi:hypothetical protein